MELQITTLIENQQDDNGELLYEHGLSLYIEFQGKKLLFDTGQTGNFLENAKKSDKSLETVDYIIISHGHYDHSGGVVCLMSYLTNDMSETKQLPISGQTPPALYVGKEFFVPKYKKMPDGSYHFNGNSFSEEDIRQYPVELVKVEENITYITENIILFKNFKRTNDYEHFNPKFYVKTGENYILDEFVDEIALGLITSKGVVLVVGCSHVGIVNIVNTVIERIGVPVYAVLGGTHLVEAEEERIRKTMEAFEELNLQQIAVSHCTGENGITAIRNKFTQGYINNNTGNIYHV